MNGTEKAVLRDLMEHCAKQETRRNRFLSHELVGREKKHAYGPDKVRLFVDTWRKRRELLEALLAATPSGHECKRCERLEKGLRIIAQLEDDPDRFATDEQIAEHHLALANQEGA